MKRRCVVLAVLGLASGLQAAEAPEQGVHTTLTLKVTSFQESLKAIQDLAASNGLRVSSTALESTQKGRKHGWVKLDVPTEQVDATLVSLNLLGKTVDQVAGPMIWVGRSWSFRHDSLG